MVVGDADPDRNRARHDDSADLLVQSGGTATLGLLNMTGGTIANQTGGTLSFSDAGNPAQINGGLFRSFGATTFDAGLIVDGNGFEVLGNLTSVAGTRRSTTGGTPDQWLHPEPQRCTEPAEWGRPHEDGTLNAGSDGLPTKPPSVARSSSTATPPRCSFPGNSPSPA